MTNGIQRKAAAVAALCFGWAGSGIAIVISALSRWRLRARGAGKCYYWFKALRNSFSGRFMISVCFIERAAAFYETLLKRHSEHRAAKISGTKWREKARDKFALSKSCSGAYKQR